MEKFEWYVSAPAMDDQYLPGTPAAILMRSYAPLPSIQSVIKTYYYKGYHNLKQGLNYKQFLQDKIANLDAIITYLQDLQTNNQ